MVLQLDKKRMELVVLDKEGRLMHGQHRDTGDCCVWYDLKTMMMTFNVIPTVLSSSLN